MKIFNNLAKKKKKKIFDKYIMSQASQSPTQAIIVYPQNKNNVVERK